MTRDEAKALNLTHYFTGKPCKSGHISKRNTHGGYCYECKRNAHRVWELNNPEKYKASIRCAKAKHRLKHGPKDQVQLMLK